MSLRLRDSDGGASIQTFKSGQGLTRRELEWPAPDGLNLEHADLRAALRPRDRRALAPVFTVAITRRQRTFEYQGSSIELALDEGAAHRGDQIRAICEVELELKAGSSEVLFDLARAFSKAAPLRLSFLGKASQGQLLIQQPPSLIHTKSVLLSRDTSPADAFQALARRAFVDFALHAEAYSEFGGERALHAARVSARRLKSYLATFRPLLDETGAKAMRKHLNWLLQTSAEARNIDVFAQTYLDAESPQELSASVAAARANAHTRTRGALASGRFRDLLLDLSAWVETRAWRGRTDLAIRTLEGRIKPFARRALDRALKGLLRRAEDLRALNPEARHEIRLKVKRLRYVLEAFEPLFSSGESVRYLATLRSIQSDLGDYNDAATAEPMIGTLGLGEDEAHVRELVMARAKVLEARISSTNRKLKGLLGQSPPWAT